MGWFRRRDEDQESGLPEAPPEADRQPAEEGESAPEPRATPEALASAPAAAEMEAEAEAPPEAGRPGFFRRLFGGRGLAPEEAPEAEAETGEAREEGEAVSEEPAAREAAAPEGGAEPQEEAAEEPRKGLFRRFRERLGRTREALSGGLTRLFAGRKVDAELLDELEELLITADLGVETTLALMATMRERVKRRELGDVERLKGALAQAMLEMLAAPAPEETPHRPRVVLLVGVNGVGKTTTIAKLAYQDRQAGRLPLLVAADTFRAAAAEQLAAWGQRLGVDVVRQQHGADPAAVVFDGLAAALSREVDTVYIDTAGRLHTKVNLMEELKKIHRTIGKKIPGAPHEIYLVLDATTGQNALSQARLFQEAVGVTGIVLTKLDGTAKGGVALAVAHETGIPLCYLGVGEGLDDLKPFDPEAFVAAILE